MPLFNKVIDDSHSCDVSKGNGCVIGAYFYTQAVQHMVREASPASNKAGVAAYVFTTQAHSTFIGVRRVASYEDPDEPYQYRFVVFDSHTRDRTTGLYLKNGKSVTGMVAISAHLRNLFRRVAALPAAKRVRMVLFRLRAFPRV